MPLIARTKQEKRTSTRNKDASINTKESIENHPTT